MTRTKTALRFSIKALILTLIFSIFISKSVFASTSSIIIDAKSGKVISSSNADELRYPASLTKVMTLYITFDALDKGLIKMSDKLTVSRNAANKAPSRLGLRPGQKITVETAVMALVVKSANDCASVLAEGLGYSEDNFAKTMTKVARELGMKNTTFKNASGLPNSLQKTTARDMALLGAAMYHHFPKYYELFATKKFSYNGHTFYTHNRILKSFKGADGMKTGFTNAAGYNIITSAEREGNRVIAVTMGHRTSKARDQHVSTMMSKGLNKIALNDKATKSDMYANLEEPSAIETIESEQDLAASESAEISVENISEWGIQVGAFSNYSKARNYALSIKKEITPKFKNKTVDIEAVRKNSAVIYRSKIIGFAKNDAEKACKGLKRTNKSCIVIAIEKSKDLLLAHYEKK